MLFTAARAALFLESLEAGAPELPLTAAAVARRLGDSAGGSGDLACEAFERFRAGREEGLPLPQGLLAAFEGVVRDLRAYRDSSVTT